MLRSSPSRIHRATSSCIDVAIPAKRSSGSRARTSRRVLEQPAARSPAATQNQAKRLTVVRPTVQALPEA